MFDRAPPIAKLSHRILADVENAVRRFSRFHKYSSGADLRFYAMQVARCVHKAWRDPEQRQARVLELCGAVDDLKISVQLTKEVKAFGGSNLLRVDVPIDAEKFRTTYYGSSAIYALHVTDEAAARALAARMDKRPAYAYALETSSPRLSAAGAFDNDDDDRNEDDV